MMEDLDSNDSQFNNLLLDLNERFLNENKIMSCYGLPMPKVRVYYVINFIML